MEWDSIRPVLSGSLGGTLAVLLCRALSRWIPRTCNGKHARTLVREYRWGIRCANLAVFAGLIGGISIYQCGYLPADDWRGLALGVGAGSLLALVSLSVAGLARRSPREALVAFAMSQSLPLPLLYALAVAAIAAFAAAAASVWPG